MNKILKFILLTPALIISGLWIYDPSREYEPTLVFISFLLPVIELSTGDTKVEKENQSSLTAFFVGHLVAFSSYVKRGSFYEQFPIIQRPTDIGMMLMFYFQAAVVLAVSIFVAIAIVVSSKGMLEFDMLKAELFCIVTFAFSVVLFSHANIQRSKLFRPAQS